MRYVRAIGHRVLDSGTHATAGWTLIAAVAVATLAGNMPAHGFFSGDPGVKLIAAFNVAQHPGRPFTIDLPRLGGQPGPWVDRFFQVHGDHAHALQSPVFPAVSAPFVTLAGIRGAYVLPALGFVVLVPLIEAMRRALVPSVSPLLAGTCYRVDESERIPERSLAFETVRCLPSDRR